MTLKLVGRYEQAGHNENGYYLINRSCGGKLNDETLDGRTDDCFLQSLLNVVLSDSCSYWSE